MVTYFTRNGLQRYKKHISELEKKLRDVESQTQESIDSGGDCWHDNAGYEQIIQDLRVRDARLIEAYKLLKEAELVEYPTSVDRVVLGTKVQFYMDEEEKTYEIVAHGDDNIEKKRILYASPIARQLLDHKVDDYFKAQIGGKIREIEIISIEPLQNIE